jgi:hypothetical protein
MAAHNYSSFSGPTCSFEEAIRFVASIRDGPSLFSRQEWPDEAREGFWRLLRELARERRTIDSYSSLSFPRGQPVDAAYYRQAWSTLKAAEAAIGRTVTLPVDENFARQVDGLEGMRVVRSITRTFRNFIKAIEDVLGFIRIDTDSLTQALLAPESTPAPAPVVPAAPPPTGGEGDTSLETMIKDAYETGGARNKEKAYDIVRKRALKAGFHVSEDRFEDVRKGLGVTGKVGRPRKNPPS